MSEVLKRIVALIPKSVRRTLKALWARMTFMHWFLGLVHAQTLTRIAVWRNAKKGLRKLEIGPGSQRIPGFETLNVRAGFEVDYVADASKQLRFSDHSFDLIYASHVLEHIPWYQLQQVVDEWVRILKPGGSIEIWVPDGLRIANAFLDGETGGNEFHKDGWYKFNPERDPCVWANGRTFSYGDGDGRKSSPNWHMALLSPRYLELLLKRAGLVSISALNANEIRGHDHGWINLGMRGRRP